MKNLIYGKGIKTTTEEEIHLQTDSMGMFEEHVVLVNHVKSSNRETYFSLRQICILQIAEFDRTSENDGYSFKTKCAWF